MADDNTNRLEAPQPNPDLESLNRLVGTWQVSGPDISGQVTYEWLAGGFLLATGASGAITATPTQGLGCI